MSSTKTSEVVKVLEVTEDPRLSSEVKAFLKALNSGDGPPLSEEQPRGRSIMRQPGFFEQTISYNDLANLWNRLVSWLTGRSFALNLPIPRGEEKTRQYERVTVRCIAPGRYKLLYSPNRVHGLAAGDVFVLAPKEECGFRVLTRGGNVCVWFDFDARYQTKCPEAVILCRSVEALGGRVDAERAFSLTFTIPSSAGLANIDNLLRQTAHRIPWSIYQYGSKPDEDAP